VEIALCVVIALVVVVATWERRTFVQLIKDTDAGYLEHIAKMEREHQSERRELLNRIQHPTHMPMGSRVRTREKPSDEQPTQRIGTIAAPKAEA
jgi:hypothetical protein